MQKKEETVLELREIKINRREKECIDIKQKVDAEVPQEKKRKSTLQIWERKLSLARNRDYFIEVALELIS